MYLQFVFDPTEYYKLYLVMGLLLLLQWILHEVAIVKQSLLTNLLCCCCLNTSLVSGSLELQRSGEKVQRIVQNNSMFTMNGISQDQSFVYALEPFLQDCENICICCKWEVFSFFFCFFLFVCLNSIRLSVKTCNQCPNLNIFCKVPFPNRKSVSSCQKKIFVARKDTFYAILHSIFPAKYLSHFRT